MSDLVKRVLNGTFCILPFVHQHQGVGKQNYLCCDSNVPIGDIFDEHSDQLRQQIWSGQPIPHCVNCYQMEQSGQISPRQEHTIRWLKDPEVRHMIEQWEPGQIPQVLSYDVRSDNTCNLACIMCHPNSSSLWARELGQPTTTPLVLNHEKMLGSRYVYLAGGEPLLIDECVQFIHRVAHSEQQPELVINTNLTTVGDQTFADLAKIKHLTLVVSVDAFGFVNEYHRWPMTWIKFMRNLERACELVGPGAIMFNTVIDAVSVFGLGGLTQIEHYANSWNIKNLTVPDVLTIQNVPDRYKSMAANQLNQLTQSRFYHTDIAFKRAVEHAQDQLSKPGRPDLLREYINKLDQRRSLNHSEYLGVNFNE